jgi:hypothetical protein
VRLVVACPARPTRVLLDGVGSGELADSLVAGLVAAGRAPVK